MNYMRSEKRPVKTVDYGFVGDVKEVQSDILADLIAKGFFQVFSLITNDYILILVC